MNELFSISKITAGYAINQPVLSIEKLNFEKQKTTFILGKSGIGKSTLLELLGLMNNTLLPGANANLSYSNGIANQSYFDLWKTGDAKLARFRNANFSFIFQNENLMHNFSAGENMCFTQMMQGRSFKEAKEVTLKFMSQLNIEETKFNASVSHFSGGQRQRLSFIRALATNYKVLFGDEPTGNLDSFNATKMIETLKTDLEKKQASAIVVSHHIELALEFADQIIVITPKINTNTEDKIVGEIVDQNIFNRAEWISNKASFKAHLENSIK